MEKSFYIETYGCQMNRADSASMEALFKAKNATHAACVEDADIIIVNTCVVRKHAENRIYGRLGYFRHLKATKTPHLIVAVTGCLARYGKDALVKEHDVDIVADVYSQEELVDAVLDALTGDRVIIKQEGYRFKSSQPDPAYPFKAFVSITHGCDNWCAYCIVPAVRGGMVSRESGNIIEEVRRLVGEGVKEVTLLGQNVNSYGEERKDISFVDLLYELAPHMGNAWLRFLTSHPKDVSPRLARAFADIPALCEQLHLPVQSGSTRVLTRMRRKYTREDYLEKVAAFKSCGKDIAFSTDVLVGFADETDKEFEETLSLLDAVRFEEAYMYRYSERAGTLASKEGIAYDEEKGKERLSILIERQRAIEHEIKRALIGKTMEALIEQPAKDRTHLLARSREGRMILLPHDAGSPGDFVTVCADTLRGSTLIAHVLSPEEMNDHHPFKERK